MASVTEDGTSVANFTAIHGSGLSVSGGTFVNSGAGAYDGSQHNTAMSSGDHHASAVVGGKSSQTYLDTKVRHNGSTGTSRNGWIGTLGGTNEYYITEVTAGVGTDRVTGTTTFNNGDVLDTEASGTTIRLKVNVSSIDTYTSSLYQANTRVGMGIFRGSTVGTLDNFAAADLSTGINGSASITLAGATTSATGVLPLVGSSSTTLASVTTTATGRLPLAGTASLTLAAATLTATGGATPNNGAASLTLDAVTVAGVSDIDIAGAAAITLAATTTAAAGTLPIAGAASITLAAATTTGTGALPIVGAASITLGATTTTAEGVLTSLGSGQAAITLADATTTAAGAVALRGAASITLDAVTSSATGALPIVGSSSLTLDALTIVATGGEDEPAPEPAPVQGPGFFSGGPYEPIKKAETKKARLKAPKRVERAPVLEPIRGEATCVVGLVSMSATGELGLFTVEGLKRTAPKPQRAPLAERVEFLEREVSTLRRALATPRGSQKEQ